MTTVELNKEMACVYACLMMLDDNVPVTENKLEKVLSAADISIEPFYTKAFAKCCQQKDYMQTLLTNASSVNTVSAPTTAAVETTSAPVEEKKEESEEEDSGSDNGFGLFD
ncbi:60S acidic ribosomal protein P1 [Intoshia linei]|uniref:Large ribosomal subunit protein P2 n=1 Tax=Intoshia linei TaxID=1819745 RepID=A0A177B0Y2_9BILA|nr:60S acidic ribosomal protein P1 [Intoshia linei]